jgi:hypothetical protein
VIRMVEWEEGLKSQQRQHDEGVSPGLTQLLVLFLVSLFLSYTHAQSSPRRALIVLQ